MNAPATPSAELESVKRLCPRLHHAYRGLRLYPADHPAARHALEGLTRALVAHLNRWGLLALEVEEAHLLFQDEEVYFQEDSRGNLAFIMFRDGIRFLVFHPGISEDEVEVLVDCLAHADELAGIEHDLTTSLWERDLQHIEYEVVDPFLGAGGESLRSGTLSDLRDTVVRRLGELSPGTGAGSGVAVVGADGGAGAGSADAAKSAAAGEGNVDEELGGLDFASVTLTEEEVELGEAAVVDLSQTVLADFALVLMELAGNSSGPPGGEEVLARSITLVAEQFIDGGDADGFAAVVNRLQSLEAQGRRPPEFAQAAVGNAVTAERLTRLIEWGAQGSPDEAAPVDGLLAGMRNWILPSLLEILAESGDKGVRKTVLALLDLEGGVPVRYLWPLMDDPRWYVVRNAVQLATGSGAPDLPGQLGRLVRHPDARVRREVMRSLDNVGGGRSAILLARALSDGDASVRTLAAYGLARHGNRGQIAAVQVHVESRDLGARPSEEIAALLWAYASLGGEATVDVLNKLWRRRLIGTQPLPVRLAAIQALGAIDSPAAREALSVAARSGEAQLARAAARVLSGGRAGATGHGA
jgi:hypothetical protein